MRHRTRRVAMLAASVLLAAPTMAPAKSIWISRTPEFLATLKPGQWVRLEGAEQKDHTLSCVEMKLLAGDFVDDDCKLVGIVGRVDVARNEFTIASVPIHPARDAEFESPENTLNSIADVQAGMIIEVEGTYGRDGFLADQVDDETEELRDKYSRLRMTARIERVDVGKRRIQVMGLVFVVSDRTQIKSALR